MRTRMLVLAAGLSGVLTVLAAEAVSARPRLGYEGVLRWNDFTTDSEWGFEPTLRLASAFGGVAQFAVAPAFSVTTGVRWHRDVERLDFHFLVISNDPPETSSFTVRTRLEYLGVPLRLECRPARMRGLVAEGGAELSWLMDAHRQVYPKLLSPQLPAPPGSQRTRNSWGDDVTGEFRRWSVAVTTGVGWKVPTSGPEQLLMRMRGSYALTNSVRNEGVHVHTRALELGAELTW